MGCLRITDWEKNASECNLCEIALKSWFDRTMDSPRFTTMTQKYQELYKTGIFINKVGPYNFNIAFGWKTNLGEHEWYTSVVYG